ncbi:histone family protein nucleoid-structuring protein H-NS [Caballeronia terrestris]|uniref:Histone family protein nucleoid-structuring protein H-NS n=1 Tax=Caballeronia terrestris TaxID=1226301 RepID=A0A158KF60_9BURK|nr:H-NS family nucleoid-associated regulatory protein [Caballeronia terrestris]SAL79766.1 histone family protein nucleoid-structuring protein H-NS [Caballeronia terrestris]
MTTLERIQAKLKQLQQEADALIARKAQVAVDQIRELMLKHGLTTADIEAKAKARREAVTKEKLPPKYRNAKTGETWSGHARPPAWIKDVKDRTRFLIDSTGIPSAKLKRVTTKGNAKRTPLPAKYRDPKSGATWSGRGPAPAWLASAKDRNKFLIDSGSTVSLKATKSKAALNGSAVSKKTRAKTSATPPAKKASASRKSTATSAKTKAVAKKISSRRASAPKKASAAASNTAAPA